MKKNEIFLVRYSQPAIRLAEILQAKLVTAHLKNGTPRVIYENGIFTI
jgi:hypothetical protein